MEFVNLTPHEVTIVYKDTVRTLPPSGEVARVKPIEVPVGDLDGIPVIRRAWGPIEGLPEPAPGVRFLVSALVLERVPPLRHDVLAPDTGATALRDPAGIVVAVRRLVIR